MTVSFLARRAQNLARAAWLVVVLLATITCGPRSTPILITLTGDLTDAESIQITPVLNGQAGQVITHDPSQKQHVLWIPESESGQLRIEGEGKSSKADACKLAHASAEVTFTPDVSKPTAVELNFPTAQCLLTVELRGFESVTSQPPGLDCPAGVVLCRGWFSRGQPVQLKAGTRPSSRYGQWNGACQAQGASCEMTVKAESKVEVSDRRGICSKDDWCWQNPLPQGNGLLSVWGSDPSNVWAVGDSGTILKWNGTSWAAQPSGTSAYLTGVWGSAPNNVWAVGYGGTILKWNGTVWSSQASGVSPTLRGIWGSDAKNVWAAGDVGTIVWGNGIAWSPQPSGTSNAFNGVWGSNAKNVCVMQDGGSFLRWNGTFWSPQARGTSPRLFGVWGSDANNVWAVGGGGTILKWNGTAWSAQSSGTSNWLFGVWGSDANNVWAVGEGGTVLKWNGTAWSAQSSGTSSALYGVWGGDDNKVWVVGEGGTILRYQP